MKDINLFFLYDELSLPYMVICWFEISVYFIFDPNVDLVLFQCLNYIKHLEFLLCFPLNTWIKNKSLSKMKGAVLWFYICCNKHML
jgi:hypothetical protein